MEYIDKVVEQISVAYLSHIPIVWLVTSEKDVANQIAISFADEHYGDIRQNPGKTYVYGDICTFRLESVINKVSPTCYFKWIGDYGQPYDYQRYKEGEIKDKLEKFLDFHQAYEIEEDSRKVIDKNTKDVFSKSLLIIASPNPPNLGWINQYIEIIYVNAPSDKEIKEEIIDAFCYNYNIDISNSFADQLVVNFRGIGERQIKEVLNRCLILEWFDNGGKESEQRILSEIRKLKRQMLEGFAGLKWIPEDDDTPDASGLGAITLWLSDRKDIFSDPERKQKEGYDIPKGILVTGVPGTGKSLMAKHAAKILNLPLIAMNLGDLQEGIVGKSEEHMAAALRLIERMAPCVLWIDEIEKAFSGAESGNSDGGVMRRMFGKFLTWMQENKTFCFVFATANDITKLPPELFRSERFDEKFYNFMPTLDECAEIFSSTISCHNRKSENDLRIVIFDKSLENKDYWKKFLNEQAKKTGEVKLVESEEKIWTWDGGKRPRKKLFTGADISAFVKLLKFKILHERKSEQGRPITKREVDSVIYDALTEFMPYGETNLNDVANCFISLTKNRFKPASKTNDLETIISFDDYDEDTKTMRYDEFRFDKTPYNQALYRCAVAAINHNSHNNNNK